MADAGCRALWNPDGSWKVRSWGSSTTSAAYITRLTADLVLLLVAFLWGSAFVAQRVAAMHLGVFLFNGIRFLLGALVLLPLTRLQWKVDRRTLPWVMLAGLLLFVASALQQAGLRFTTAGNAAFITGLYVVLVPLVLVIALRQRLHWASWIAALLASVGVFLLSTKGEFRLSPGDSLELGGAFMWALHVIIVSKIVRRLDVIQFAVGQYFVCGLLNMMLGLGLELRTLEWVTVSWWTILYTGIFSIAIGYTLQAIGQKHAPPTDAAIILSMEAVFAALFGYLFLSELLSIEQILGCSLILSGIILTQVRGNTALN
jgi:drug/metabolite transporter (DMT)-like permease